MKEKERSLEVGTVEVDTVEVDTVVGRVAETVEEEASIVVVVVACSLDHHKYS